MIFRFHAYPDYSKTIQEKIEKLRKKFKNLPETIINTKTHEMQNSDLLQWEVEILLRTIKYEGFSYVATLKKEVIEENGVSEIVSLIYPANNFDGEDFTPYFDKQFRCDHCHTNRNRYTVHLFRDENGVDLMIASTCAKEYFGVSIARELDLICRYSKMEIEDEFSGYGRCHFGFDKTGFCKSAYGVMAIKNNYRSQKAYNEQCEYDLHPQLSTNEYVKWLLNKGFNSEEECAKVEERKIVSERAKDFDLEPVKEFWRNLRDENPNDNFIRSCTLNFSMIEPKTGLLVYGIFRYMKDIEGFFTEKSEMLPSNHFGSVGERLKNIQLTVSMVSTIETMYGLTTIVKFVADTGNRFTWFSTSGFNGNQGDKVTVTGTVKKHDEYKGIKQTILTRCKITK